MLAANNTRFNDSAHQNWKCWFAVKLPFIFLSLLLFSLSSSLKAQQEASNWFFGQNAGLKFSGGAPQFQSGSLKTGEGCSSISDKDGILLFYTDGIKVWNRNHQQMPGGTGLLGGDIGSSTQAALIVKQPGNDSLYYIFTVDENPEIRIGPQRGLRYSIVNIKKENGLGDIVEKNNALIANFTHEKVAGIRHANGQDYWIVTHHLYQNVFSVFRLSSTGVTTTPLKFNLGNQNVEYYASGIGALKISPDGKKIAAAFTNSTLELYDFDNSTGRISNSQTLYATQPSNTSYLCYGPYGVEFSSDSKMLYSTRIYNCKDPAKGFTLVQYNINSPSTASIVNSEVILADLPNDTEVAAGMQLGPDGKIYIAFGITSYLGAITKPCIYGNGCNFVRSYFNLPTPAKSSFGLPNFAADVFYQHADFSYNEDCNNKIKQFNFSSVGIDSVRWNFKDQSGQNLATVSDWNPKYEFIKDGVYTAEVIAFKPCGTDTIRKSFAVGNGDSFLGTDIAVCEGELVILGGNLSGQNYKWSDGTNKNRLVVNKAGKYWVDITVSSCKLTDTIQVNFKKVPSVNIGNDTSICLNNFPHSIGITVPGANYTWNTGTATPNLNISAAGKYYLKVDVDGCVATDTILIKEIVPTNIIIGNDTAICVNEELKIQAFTAMNTYLWNTGAKTASIITSQPGKYWCEGTDNNGCKTRDTLNVTAKALPFAYLGNDTVLCDQTVIVLKPELGNASRVWQDGSSGNEFIVRSEGIYHVKVTENGCSYSDSINIGKKEKPNIFLGNDTSICYGKTLTLTTMDGEKFLWQDGSTGSDFIVRSAGIYSVEATNNCGISADEIVVKLTYCQIGFPNAFTPNGDGKNDVFAPGNAVGISDYRLEIFDRWGKKIFITNNVRAGWNGRVLGHQPSQGIYVWQASYLDNEGKRQRSNGTVALIR